MANDMVCNVTPLNIPLMQTQYEVLGESCEDIAENHGITVQMVLYAVEKYGWTRNEFDPETLQKVATQRQSMMDSVHILRQGALDPQYIKIEAAITHKAQEVIRAIEPESAKATDKLKDMTEILSKLRPTTAMMKSDGSSNEMKIVIMNRVGDLNQPESKTIDVEVNRGVQ